MQIVWTAGLSFHSMNWLWKKLVFTLSGHFADPLSNVRKTFGSTSYLSLTDEMMENQPSFELRAQPKHVSVILCSGADPEFAPLKLKRNTRPHSCSLRKKSGIHPATPALEMSFCLFVWLPRVDTALFLCTFGFAHAFSQNTTRSNGSYVSLPQFKRCGALLLTQTLRRITLLFTIHITVWL